MADLEAQMALFQAELQAVEQPHLQMPLMPPSHGPPGNAAPQMMHNQSRQMPSSMTAPPPDMLKGSAQHNGMGPSSTGSGGYQSNMGMQQQRQGGAM
ncbi:MAG: hypothetical protein WDW36_005429 [Sanguina aurantia]